MWYLTWLFGIALALGAAVINLLWLEATHAFEQDLTPDQDSGKR